MWLDMIILSLEAITKCRPVPSPVIWMPRIASRQPLWKTATAPLLLAAAATSSVTTSAPMLILMPAKMLWLFLITHSNLRELSGEM